jgi:transcription initiation factor IIE alpha subunit
MVSQELFKKVLKLTNGLGWTIAHEMASKGYVFANDEILNLRCHDGTSVKDVIEKFHEKPIDGVIKMHFEKEVTKKALTGAKEKVRQVKKKTQMRLSLEA